jgi:hypothetical protein
MERTVDLYTLMETFPQDSPLWSLVDAFDAATNGIENPEALARMELITDPSLRPWKALVRGIRALYAGDIPACRAAADSMEDDSAPGTLKPLFRAWLSRQGKGDRDRIFGELSGACDSVAKLYRRLLIEPHPLAPLAEQAEEALRHGLEKQFEGLALRIIKTLREERRCDGPLLALRYARRCLGLLDQAGYGGTEFISGVIKTLGEADGFCLLGFALIGKDNRAAAAALRKALNAGDGLFLRDRGKDPMAALLAEALPLLEAPREGAPRAAGKQGRRKKPSPQLELFEDYPADP